MVREGLISLNTVVTGAACFTHIVQRTTLVLASFVIMGLFLGCTGGRALLSERLVSPDDRTKRAAFAEMNALEISSRERYLDIIKNTLRDGNPDYRLIAVDSLGSMGSAAEEAIPYIVRLLGDERGDVRQGAQKALVKIGSAAVPAVTAELNQRDTTIRCNAADVLGAMGPNAEAAVAPLVSLLDEPEYAVSGHAAAALGRIGPASVHAIMHAVGEGNISTIETPLAAFSYLEADQTVTRELVQSMENTNENPVVRGFAAKALGKMQDRARNAIPDLAGALSDENNDVSSSAEWALTQMGTAAVPALKGKLEDRNPKVRTRAVRAIGSMGPAAENASPAILQAMEDGDSVVRIEAISALEKMQITSRTAVRALIRVMDGDADRFVRLRAVRVLNKIGTSDAKEAVSRFYGDNGHE